MIKRYNFKHKPGFPLHTFFAICYSLFVFFPCSLLFAETPEIGSQSAVVVDAETGSVIFSKNASDEIPPASLTKLMTMHLALNKVNEGKATLDDIVPITNESWAVNQPPRSSLMFLAPGQTVTLREILLGLAVPSGNDAAVAVALYLAPTVDDFVKMMNREARRMGLVKTRFVEPSGISEDNMTTSAEFAAFCLEYLRLHPHTLADFHSVREFAYPKTINVPIALRNNPRTIVQHNRNNLLDVFPGADGLKTGYIDEAGYNIALTAQRNGTRFIAVILGAPAGPGGANIRDRDGEKLLSWAFSNYKTVRPEITRLEPVKLWKGKEKQVFLKIAESTAFTAPIDRAVSLRYIARINEPLIAPLPAGYPVGRLIIADDQGELYGVKLVTSEEYQQGNIFKRIWHSIRLLFYKNSA